MVLVTSMVTSIYIYMQLELDVMVFKFTVDFAT